jgi:transposase
MKHYYLGIDVSKGYADFALLDSAKKPVMHNFQLDDTFQGHCMLYSILTDFLQQCPEAVVYAAAESTGGYENNWLSSLSSFQAGLNIRCARLNPCGVHNNSKASLNRLTTDAISARDVAEYMIAHPEKVAFDQEDRFATLRRQYNFITTLTKQKTQLLNQLESVLYSSYPELLPYCQNSMPQWVLSLLEHYPTAAEVSRANAASLANIPYITRNRAKELIQDAQKSVASATDGVSAQLITDLARQIRQMQKSINTQIEILTKSCSLQEVELLKSFPGIGETTAVGLILYIQSIKRFPSVKQFCSFCGIHPVFKQSGDGAVQPRMSKKGNPELRRLLFMVAFNGINSNPLLRSYYHRQLRQGKSKMAALGACMHKAARIVYGMLKNEQLFDVQVDLHNQEKSAAVQANKGANNTQRRYQSPDSKAPVSRRQNQKRREQSEPQSAQGTEKRGHHSCSLETA